MAEIRLDKAFPICAWEYAIRNRSDIEFCAFFLHKGKVLGVKGIIKNKSRSFEAKWLTDGRCFYRGKRCKYFDIIFDK